MDLGDTAYSYNNDKNGVYFFWDEDAEGYSDISATASALGAGHLAIAGAIGLVVGAIITTLILLPKRKKESEM